MAIKAGVGFSNDPDPRSAAEAAAAMAVSRLAPRKADWMLVFGAARYFQEDLGRFLRNNSGVDNIVGCSARGVITTEAEHYGEKLLGVMAVSAPDLSFTGFYEDNLQFKNHAIGDSVARLTESRLAEKPAVCIFPDPYSFRAPVFFRGFEERTGSYPLVGGTASNPDREARTTYQLLNDRRGFNALSGFILGGDMISSHGVSQAHYPIGESLLITKAHKNIIVELDGEPAMEVMAQELRKYVEQVGGAAPRSLHIALASNPDTRIIKRGEYVIRDVLGVDTSNQAIAAGEQVMEGQKLSFALENSYGAREDFRATVREMKESSPDLPPAFGILIKCSSRNPSFYNKKNVDLGIVKEAWGEFPLIGFESSSELAPLGNKNYEHKYSVALLLVFPAGV